MVKIYPEIINFLFFCPEKIKYYPKKYLPKVLQEIYPKNLLSHRVQ